LGEVGDPSGRASGDVGSVGVVPPTEATAPTAATADPAAEPHSAWSGKAQSSPKGTRRSVASRWQQIGVVSIALIGGAAGVLLSDASPTGTPALDAVERFLLIAVVALSAARARRWTFLVGSVIVAIAGAGVGAWAGVAALFATVGLVEFRVRSRMAGAVIGSVIGLVALNLSIGGPIVVEPLLGVAAVGPILVSGYRRSTRDTRRSVRRALVVVVVCCLVALLVAGVAALWSVGDVRAAVRSTEEGLAAAQNAEGAAASESLQSAHESFSTATRKIGAWWSTPARIVPGVGANVTAVQASVHAGAELTEGAATLVGDVDFESVLLDGGGVDLGQLESLRPRVTAAGDALRTADDAVRAAGSVWTLGPLTDALKETSGRLEGLSEQSEHAIVALDGLPPLLGADGPRRYLVLLANPAESRDMGGHIGNWAELTAEDGRIDLVDVGGPLDLSLPADSGAAILGSDYGAALLEMQPTRYPQNLGSSPDLEEVARLAAEIFRAATGHDLDGVMYADVFAFAAFLELVGPVSVSGLEDGREIDSSTAVQFLTVDQYRDFSDEGAANDSLELLIEEVFDRLTTTKMAGPAELGSIFGPLVAQGRLQFATTGGPGEMLDHFGLGGTVPDPQGGDLLGVFNRNAGPSKVDAFLERQVSVDVDWDPASGDVRSFVAVRLTNDVPAGESNRLLVGNVAGAAPGTNVTDVVVMSPFRLRTVLVNGVESSARPLLHGDLWRHTVRVAVPGGATATVAFHLEGEVDPGPRYRMEYVGQPLLRPGEVEVTVASIAGDPVVSRTKNGHMGSDSVTIGQHDDTSVSWAVGR
jgi:hypothetical protein